MSPSMNRAFGVSVWQLDRRRPADYQSAIQQATSLVFTHIFDGDGFSNLIT